jgi:hypothetical protein
MPPINFHQLSPRKLMQTSRSRAAPLPTAARAVDQRWRWLVSIVAVILISLDFPSRPDPPSATATLHQRLPTPPGVPRASPLSAGQRPSQQMPRDVHTGSRSTTTTPCRHVRRRTSASTREADRLRRQTHQYASPSSFVSWPLRQPLSARDSAKELQQRQQSPPRMPFHHHLPALDSYSIFPMPSPSLLIGSAPKLALASTSFAAATGGRRPAATRPI